MNMMSGIGMGGMMSPRAMMDKRIDAGVQSGSISETDEAALETALDAIDSALGVGSSSGSTQTSKLAPSQMGDRIDDLIEEQVKAGTLTDEQASTLQSLFAQNAPPSGASAGSGEESDELAMGGVEGAGCAGGMRPMGPPPSSASDSESDEDSSSTSETDQTQQLDALIAFLNNMREKMASGNVYGASSSTSGSSNSGLIVDSYA